jgi:hypothetical protein
LEKRAVRISNSNFTIQELIFALERKEIVINKDYQRESGFWPLSAKSYFIDTILEGFPFPKLYFYQSFDPSERKGFREVVDGQQRLTTIRDFIANKFRLSAASRNYRGLRFEELSLEKQQEVLLFPVEVAVILNAERSDLLEMFRRMNAYTTPLNSAEKRHAEFQGEFKWFIVDQADQHTRSFESYRVLSQKQIVRMGDALLLSEMVQVLDCGIVDRSDRELQRLYKDYNESFPNSSTCNDRIAGCLGCIFNDFKELRGSYMMKDYALLSLFTALAHLRYGIPNGKRDLDVESMGIFYLNHDKALDGLLRLAEAHENDDLDGDFREYVKAATGATTRKAQRITRARSIIKFLIAR